MKKITIKVVISLMILSAYAAVWAVLAHYFTTHFLWGEAPLILILLLASLAGVRHGKYCYDSYRPDKLTFSFILKKIGGSNLWYVLLVTLIYPWAVRGFNRAKNENIAREIMEGEVY